MSTEIPTPFRKMEVQRALPEFVFRAYQEHCALLFTGGGDRNSVALQLKHKSAANSLRREWGGNISR